ncbi:MAG TPA: hypothetical protein VGP64_17545 [Polyangia bacterium]
MKIVGGLGLLMTGAASILAAGCHSGNLVTDNGRCGPNPKVLVPAGSYPQMSDAGAVPFTVGSMTLDGSDLYVVLAPAAPGATSGEVMRVSTRGGSPVLVAEGYLFDPPAFTPSSVILGYVDPKVNAASIVTFARTGNGEVTVANLTALSAPPVTDGVSVYFVDSAGVESVPLDSPTAAPTPTLLAAELPTGIGVFGQHLLLLEADGNVDSLPIGADAGGATTIGKGSAAIPGSLVPCGASACWLGTGVIYQIDPATGPLTTLANLTGPVAAPSGLAYDGTSSFVSGQSGPIATSSAIVSVSGASGAQVVVAMLPSSSAIAVDDACVYFSTSTGIFSLLKSATGAVIP